MAISPSVVGDLLPVWAIHIVDSEDGVTPIDLTGGTAVSLRFEPNAEAGGTGTPFTGAGLAAITLPATAGIISYALGASDVVAGNAGPWLVWPTVTFPGGTRTFNPIPWTLVQRPA